MSGTALDGRQQPSTREVRPPPRRLSVWLVDDSPLQLEISRRALAPSYEVTTFTSGAAMLEKLASAEAPELLVLDWHMPDLLGVDVCRFVRTSKDSAELPILMLTCDGAENTVVDALSSGANDFLKLPCSPRELIGRVSALVEVAALHAKLQHAQAELRLEASFRERFIGILAHDLRQPLNVMRLANETLCQATPNGLNASIHAMHRRAGQRMQRMITELLDFTGNRPESGLPLQLRSTDLAAIVAASLDEIRLLHPARSLELHSSPVGPCLGAWDPDRLVQLCGNLIGNAIEHSPPGSAVSIELTSDVTTAQLRISNTGNPIPPDILATLFHPFRRPSQRTRSNGGVGLGLHIVKQVVSAHSGSITVESDETATVFSVSLPRQLEAPTH
ncbi:MAG: hypothetical protein RL033_3120 [Pseudomonadota bacterium]|jgi:signal transduction histidine kinase